MLNKLHVNPAKVSVLFAVTMFMARKRELETWMGALEGIGMDKKDLEKIINAPNIPEHWMKE